MLVEKSSMMPQPIPVRIREPVNTHLGSQRSASGPRITAPRDIPRYMMEMA